MQSTPATPPMGQVPMQPTLGSANEIYWRQLIAYVASRDPGRAAELELLFGIRKWVEYLAGTIVVLTIMVTITLFPLFGLLAKP